MFFCLFQTAIANATTLAEVERLKGLLQAGQIPGRERKSGNSIRPDALCDCHRDLHWKGQTGSQKNCLK